MKVPFVERSGRSARPPVAPEFVMAAAADLHEAGQLVDPSWLYIEGGHEAIDANEEVRLPPKSDYPEKPEPEPSRGIG